MSSWRKLAEELRDEGESQQDRHNRHDSAAKELPANPLALFRGWGEALSGLDPARPGFGLDAARWAALLRDADWLLEKFGRQAACDGWSAADLFGVLPGHDGWGGIADRLRGSRSLVMTADLAGWRRMFTGTPDSFARVASAMPRLVALWDTK